MNADPSNAAEMSSDLRARLEADVHSIMRYFLDLASTVENVAEALTTEAQGELSCHHPALQAERLTMVARHLRTFALHPDCAALDASAGPAPAARVPLELDSRGMPVPPWRTRDEQERRYGAPNRAQPI